MGSFATAVRAAADSPGSLTANLDSIDFPNSSAAEAQDAFLTGMKALHSFEFEHAGEAFREARGIDPEFALAYWGETLSHNHPLWGSTRHSDTSWRMDTSLRNAPQISSRSSDKGFRSATLNRPS